MIYKLGFLPPILIVFGAHAEGLRAFEEKMHQMDLRYFVHFIRDFTVM